MLLLETKEKKEETHTQKHKRNKMTSNKEPILIIAPTELKFKFEVRKQIPATLVLQNPATHTVAFKIKTTTPKKYCVRPSTGFVLPQSKVPIQIMMSSQKEKPQDFESCRDKFLVQSVKLSEEEAGHPISPNLFSKQGGKDVHEFKLKVGYVQSSAVSPVRESSSAVSSKEANGVMKSAKAAVESSPGLPSPPGSAKRLGGGEASASKRKSADRTGGEGGSGGGALPMKTQMTLKGFSLLHLFIAAVLAFFIGRFTSSS